MGTDKIDKEEISHILILKGRSVVPGVKEGKALVLSRSFSAFGGINPFTGKIIEPRHPQKGENVRKTVLIFPNGKGSSGFSLYFHILNLRGRAPRAMIINKVNSLTALAAVVGNIPTIGGPFELDKDPPEILKTGDKLVVDATKGLVFKVSD
ncbi:MAG: DUF126 domain-containing protein [Thermoplasmata archaeon]|nr:MAG: DUF126 domain-containing protein [Thermoplasmata archaeon]